MKNRASVFLKQMISLLSSVVKAKSLAVKNKTSAIKTRLIILSLLKNKKGLLSSVTHKLHALVGHHDHDNKRSEDADEHGDQSRKAIVLYNAMANEWHANPNCMELVKVEENGDEDDYDQDGKYPDLTHSLFDSEADELDFAGGSVIDLVRNSKEDGQNFSLEDEIDHVADLFIRKFHRQMKMQKLESFKRSFDVGYSGYEIVLMEGKRIYLQFLLLLIASVASQLRASDVLFYESFDETFEGRWIVSEKDDYQGVWKHAKSEGHDDFGLLVSEKARKYAIVKELDEPVNLKEGTVVLQFETRLQDGLECGGAYLKYLRPQEAGWKSKEFNNESPYSIMFGPDKCGSTNKVHFILKHKNPKSQEYIEHHVKYPPTVPSDKLSHVYTAILKPDNELQILIDGEEKKKVNFLSAEDFEPPLLPAMTIPDPDDKKPEDWDERAKIPDPNAVKPDDWDEDAPMEIEDEDAVKPEGWLDDEPEEIDDPEATKPEDWDDEEDGEWEAPKVDNPKCDAAPGCGEWKRPMKRNPAYKGKWHAPLIDNPNYKGIWKPQQIPNPEYFELDKPDFEPVAAIGIEIWTMQDGILFDNFLIASDEKVAETYREKTWKPKFEVEKEKQKAEEAAASLSDGLAGFQKKIFDLLYKVSDIPFLDAYKLKIFDLIEKGEKQPNLTIGILVSIVVVILTVFFRLLFGGKKPTAKVRKETKNPTGPAETRDNQGSHGEGEVENEEDTAAPRRRATRRET
ncbi:hypothetical protein NE237_007665 [Protea cynaroides]|uniref:Calnexin n=1 Tax=Protea cynaroides TaxID=273540 RepID=A0A9Q0KQI0_9MAGN|nr:hypothetical protein NE237_007665 [Protea cynaroides]